MQTTIKVWFRVLWRAGSSFASFSIGCNQRWGEWVLSKIISLQLVLFLACGFSPALAENATATTKIDAATELQLLIEKMHGKGTRVIILEPEGPAAPVVSDEPSISDKIELVESNLKNLFASARREISGLDEKIVGHWPDDGWEGLLTSAMIAVVALLLGWVARFLLRSMNVARWSGTATTGLRAERYRLGLRAAVFEVLGIAVQVAIAVAVFLAFFEIGSPGRDVGYAVILMGGLYLLGGLAVVNVMLPAPQRDPTLEDADIDRLESLRSSSRLLVGTLACLAVYFSLIDRLSLGSALFDASRLVMGSGFLMLLASVTWRKRRSVTKAFFADPSSFAARSWATALLAYFAVAFVLFVSDILLGVGITGIGVLAPIYCGFLALALYAVIMLALTSDRHVEIQSAGTTTGAATGTGPAVAEQAEPDFDGQTIEEGGAVIDCPEWRNASLAGTLALAFWVGSMAWSWGIPFFSGDGERVNGFWTALFIVTIARVSWIVIRHFFDRKIAAEGGVAVAGEPGDEGGSKGSRLGTVLPLFRTFLLITVAAIAVMIVLSQLGMNIAPIFAGAGLVGVAVGFGAQSLVRDIFSGLFFLIDDAFRVGEYIETGGLRGTVEKISIRSMQVRHHTGPLHTIPFGEITQLTNFSRDWVIMKLPLRVTFDTDPERVRKLVKKLGQELLSDPVIGDKFVEPLKSQGVREIDDSGQIIRVKFMTRPGEQFVLRKTVYARIRELFEREGIEFARREVRVRVSGKDDLSAEQLEEIAGAAAEGNLAP